ncbi:MAG TPA: hypothetical protein VKV17_03425 [Bryobacteraceae bacterium]|nr:hypothetical protein [Bryobacteraceae bacterium]
MRAFSLLLLLSIPPAAFGADAAALPPDILTNDGIVQLSNAGFSDAFIVQKILLSRTKLDTTVEGLAFLRRHSVSEQLIQYVMQHEAQPAIAAGVAQSAPPALVRMKVVKAKLLVPMTGEPGRSGLFHRAPYYAVSQALTGPASPAYSLPAHPLLQSPVFPGAGAPVTTPAETQSLWLAVR